jgi:hypothetical protein
MKKITLNYQIWVRCSQEIEVPDDYVVPTDKSGYAEFQDLREKYPDHEVWDTIPDSDADGCIDLDEHAGFITGYGLDIQEEGKVYRSDFSIETN